MHRFGILRFCLCLLYLIPVIAPVASASPDPAALPGSQNIIIQDNAELLSSLKMHAAYIGKTQEARMDGVIQYIERISGGMCSARLYQIQEDYLIAALSIPVLRSADEINTAREEMRHQSILFADETNAKLVMFNGTTDEMRVNANASMRVIEESFNGIMYSSWLSSEATRLTLFNESYKRRTATLEMLSSNGLDVSEARNLSDQIVAQHAELEDALLQNRDGASVSITSGLKQLNQQFRNLVEGYQTDAQIQMKKTEIMSMK